MDWSYIRLGSVKSSALDSPPPTLAIHLFQQCQVSEQFSGQGCKKNNSKIRKVSELHETKLGEDEVVKERIRIDENC